MLYPYMTLDDDTEIVHSDMDSNGTVSVCIERPISGGFQSATCELPSYTWKDVEGFTEEDLKTFKEIIEKGAHLILRYAQCGGFLNASNF